MLSQVYPTELQLNKANPSDIEAFLDLDVSITNGIISTKLVVSVVLTFCLLLLPLWESVIVLCFVVCYFMSILVLQSS